MRERHIPTLCRKAIQPKTRYNRYGLSLSKLQGSQFYENDDEIKYGVGFGVDSERRVMDHALLLRSAT
jgi:hypothetical protein